MSTTAQTSEIIPELRGPTLPRPTIRRKFVGSAHWQKLCEEEVNLRVISAPLTQLLC